MVQLLLEKFKFPTSSPDKNGWTPLHCAASQGHLEVCELLLQHGTFPAARTAEGTTALHYLCRSDVGLRRPLFRSVVQKLLSGGVDINAANKPGVTPLHEAALRGNVPAMQVLMEFEGLDMNSRTTQGDTALIYAARGNFTAIITLLLDHGADASITGPDGTAGEVAVSMNRRDAARVLRSRVRDPCKLCGRPFFPLCFHVAAPSIWDKFTDQQKRHQNVRLSTDLCRAYDDYFIRGILALPVLSSNATAEISASYNIHSVLKKSCKPGQIFICFGVFVQVSPAVFENYVQSWNLEGRERRIPPADGFISNVLPYFASSLNLPCKLITQCVGCRPMVEIQDVAHPIYKAQRDGLPFQIAEKIKNML